MPRLAERLNEAQRRFREIATWVSYPTQMAWQQVCAFSQKVFYGINSPSNQSSSEPSPITSPVTSSTKKILQANQLTTGRIAAVTRPPDSHGFADRSDWGNQAPAVLSLELQGEGDRYQIKSRESSGNIPLYNGVTQRGEAVWIKQYEWRERLIDSKEIAKRMQELKRLIKSYQRLSEGSNFRLIKVIGIVDEPDNARCFLIEEPVESITLAAYLAKYQRMTAQQIRKVLYQVLQTLWFLHSQQIVLLTDKEGSILPHGNLSLNSLRIRQIDLPNSPNHLQFLVYVTDLKLWEHLFSRPYSRHNIAKTSEALGTVGQDLQALGQIAYQLAGGMPDLTNSSPELDPCWEQLNDKPLQEFIIQRLLHADPTATSPQRTKSALRELCRLPSSDILTEPDEPVYLQEPVEPQARVRILPGLRFILIASIVAALVILVSYLLHEIHSSPEVTSINSSFSRISEVSTSVEEIDFFVETGSEWDKAMDQVLIRKPKSNLRLQDLLRDQGGIRFKPDSPIDPVSSDEDLFAQFTSRAANNSSLVGLMRLPQHPEISLPYDLVAYDGLVVFIPASDAQSLRAMTTALGNGITITDLRALFTTELGEEPRLRGQPVKLYFPEEETTVRAFEDIVLENNKEWVDKFRKLKESSRISEPDAPNATEGGEPQQGKIYARMLSDFEADYRERRGEIPQKIPLGFDRMGQMFGQCSVYPLSIKPIYSRHPLSAVEPLIFEDESPVTPSTDLCNTKGSYYPNIHKPNIHKDSNYPLQYQLGVVPKNSPAGQTLANILKTDEGQYYLSHAGLMPGELMPKLWRRARNDQ